MIKFLSELFAYLLFNPVLLISIIITVYVSSFIIKLIVYYNSSYYKITKNSYFTVIRDTGKLGEYMTYRALISYEKSDGKFLFNLYIPKDINSTSEIDLIMICSKGIFVFESKNYSGWIFGTENQSKWCQTLPNGKGRSHKEYFYNPILQNRTHINNLKRLLCEIMPTFDENIPIYSIIVFSNRCELKKISLSSNYAAVVNRYNVNNAINNISNQDTLSDKNITNIYEKLYPYTQVSEAIKKAHIDNINRDVN